MTKFAVYTKGSSDEVYDAEDIYDLIDTLLDEWVDGDRDLFGAMSFLEQNDIHIGIADEDVDEGTDEVLLGRAAGSIRYLLGIGVEEGEHDDEMLALFLAAIQEDERIVIREDEDEDEED